MQQRRLRLGDILDDYCPRERRITNHAIVAMIDDQVKQTRCTTCDADHEYKQARVPAPRRKKDGVAASGQDVVAPAESVERSTEPVETSETAETTEAIETPETTEATETTEAETAQAETDGEGDAAGVAAASADDDGPVHRRLIRATLPRPEGQAPERKTPEFTIRQPGGRGREFDGNSAGGGGQRHGRGRRPMRGPQAQSGGQPPRFGGPRQGNPPRHGSSPQGQRQNANRPPRGPHQGSGPGRKRGR